jgi:hypothetical protein
MTSHSLTTRTSSSTPPWSQPAPSLKDGEWDQVRHHLSSPVSQSPVWPTWTDHTQEDTSSSQICLSDMRATTDSVSLSLRNQSRKLSPPQRMAMLQTIMSSTVSRSSLSPSPSSPQRSSQACPSLLLCRELLLSKDAV